MKQKRNEGDKSMAQAIMMKPATATKQPRVGSRKPTYNELLEASIEKAIRESTPEKAREFLSGLAGYDKNGRLIED